MNWISMVRLHKVANAQLDLENGLPVALLALSSCQIVKTDTD